MRSILIPMLCLWTALASAAEPTAGAVAPAPSKLPCASQSPGGDLRNISCTLNTPSTARRFRFKVDFSGGHDDTMASMLLKLDGSPLACEPGSKTQLMGEDGDVSLECSFSVPNAASAPRELTVLVKWSHAQYTDFALVPAE
jgi:hypothetical protein